MITCQFPVYPYPSTLLYVGIIVVLRKCYISDLYLLVLVLKC